jgi:protein-disulfide isomerase
MSSRILRAAVLPVLVLLLALPTVAAGQGLSPEQKKQVEDIIRQYLLKNPEVMIEAINNLRTREEAEEAKNLGNALASRREDIERDPASPVAGNPKGDVTLVEFFDYRCGYCKRVHETVRNVLKSDGNIRFVFKEFPVLGPESMFAARAATAVFKLASDKYPALHDRIMALSARAINEESVMAEVKAIGLKPETVRQKMQDPSVLKEIERTHELAEALRIRGTPSFVVGDTLIPGATDEESLKQAVAAARGRIPARTK